MVGRPPAIHPDARTLRAADFRWIRESVARAAGIRVGEQKEPLVRARLASRLRVLGLKDYSAYVAHVRADASGREFWAMVEALATKKTDFFRDAPQLEVLGPLLDRLSGDVGEVRIWSAGCSTGEEPYTLAMLVQAWQPELAARVRILGTDLSRGALAFARAGRYSAARLAPVPQAFQHRFFGRPDADGAREVGPTLREMVAFAPLNLMGDWPMQRAFHAILCRNVMIYFDEADSRALCARFAEALVPGGLLVTGRSEGPKPPLEALGLERRRSSTYSRIDAL